MKWIKASERMPDKDGLFFTKYYLETYPDNWAFSKSASRFHKGKWLFQSDDSKKKDIEWLDENPTAGAAVTEQEEKFIKFLDSEKTALGMSDHKTIDRIKWYYKTYFMGKSSPSKTVSEGVAAAPVKGVELSDYDKKRQEDCEHDFVTYKQCCYCGKYEWRKSSPSVAAPQEGKG